MRYLHKNDMIDLNIKPSEFKSIIFNKNSFIKNFKLIKNKINV